MKKKNTVMAGVLLFFLILTGCSGRKTVEYRVVSESVSKSTEEEARQKDDTRSQGKEESGQKQASESDAGKEEPAATLFVDISGAVHCPGAYELPVGKRVFHAIAAAGGLTEEAEARCINQADLLTDGEKIYVYSREEAEDLGGWMQLDTSGKGQAGPAGGTAGDSRAVSEGRVNINLADKAALMTLPGVGEARAAAIIAYRETNGAFSCVEDIMKVAGIKEKLFQQIQDQITV